MPTEHPIEALSKALQDVSRQGGTTNKAHTSTAVPKADRPHPIETLSQQGQKKVRRMRLPPILVDEAAKLIFDYWEEFAARTQGIVPVAWERLSPVYKAQWRDIVSVALEMGIIVILRDAVATLDESNGDLGGAFAKALKRYMRERLDVS